MSARRILFANDGIGDAGGVQSYLAAVMPALAARGHEVAFLHLDRGRPGASPAPPGAPHFCIAETGVGAALAAARAWAPDVAFSHNMRPLEVDRGLLASGPVVKMMHGYAGACVSGAKAHMTPRAVPCRRALGPACLALYLPRRCGRRDPRVMAREWRWARAQQRLLPRYAAVVTASAYVRDEYLRSGAPAERVHAVPLFPTLERDPDFAPAPAEFRVAFLARMTHLKGGDLLIRAVAEAGRRRGSPVPLTMAGDGPQRAEWEALARRLGVHADFPGWVEGHAREALLRRTSLLAVPSAFPEPFGLVGLEAALLGVPAVAFDVGGIGEWLRHGVNGWLVRGDPPDAGALAEALVRAAAEPAALAAMRAGAREVALRMSLDSHLHSLERILENAGRSGAAVADADGEGGMG